MNKIQKIENYFIMFQVVFIIIVSIPRFIVTIGHYDTLYVKTINVIVTAPSGLYNIQYGLKFIEIILSLVTWIALMSISSLVLNNKNRYDYDEEKLGVSVFLIANLIIFIYLFNFFELTKDIAWFYKNFISTFLFSIAFPLLSIKYGIYIIKNKKHAVFVIAYSSFSLFLIYSVLRTGLFQRY